MALNFDSAVPLENQLVTAIGHGITGYEAPIPGIQTTAPEFLPTLQVLSPLYILSQANCSFYDPSDYSANFHICSSDKDPLTTTCQGDSGGPLFTSSLQQLGILSYGFNDKTTRECIGDTPNYWTNVAKYECFIRGGVCRKCCRVALASCWKGAHIVCCFPNTGLSANPPSDCATVLANCPANFPPVPTDCSVAPTSPGPVPTPVPPVPTPEPPSGGGKGMSGGAKKGMKSSKDPPKAPKMAKKEMSGKSSVRNRYLK
jgi:Trypsin